ncbi:MAG: hypothetical protein CFE34_10445 [Rhodobacteraceae bacterium PARR1]|nr:MAG: hypothetical protein CFE34_10445 [Rhodobacteraceae bacterium PARR1]
MTEDTDPVADGLRRAIAAADAANDAAEDIARLGKAQKDFVEKVGRAQKRSSAMATGATVGAVVCLALSTLVYFRSVGDLHEAAELQAEAAKLVAEEVLALKKVREGDAEHEDPVAKALDGLPDAVAAAVAAKLAEPVEGAAPAAVGGDVVAAIEESRDEVLAALAEMDLTGAAPAKPAAEGAAPVDAAPAAPAVPGDLTDIRESLARIEAGLLRITAAPAVPASGKAAVAPAKPAPTPAKPSGKSGAKPAAKPAAAEPNPFAFP